MLAESEECLSGIYGFDACYSYEEMSWMKNFNKNQ